MKAQIQASQYFRQSVQQSVSNNLGDFEVCQQISHGGYGHVFRIKERKTKRVFALKVLDRTRKGEQPKIKNEINIHQSLKNRYILQMDNKFFDKMNYYMVLEYCEKGDLFKYMLQQYPNFGMPVQEVKKIAEQVAKGISYLHKQDIIHNDIKVNNILINQKDEAKICDFGLSTKRKNKEKVNNAKGTLNYLAPQCFLPYDEKVDIWAFGILLYFLAIGTYPFQISSYKQLTEVLNQEKLKKFQYPTKMDPKLKDLLRKIFVFDPAKRYSINEVLNHPFITGEEPNLKEIPQEKDAPIPRMRSHASTTIESIRKSDSLKMTLNTNEEHDTYHSRRSRPSSQNKDYDSKKVKENYMGKILEKKTRMMQKYSDFDKENNINYENVRTEVDKKKQFTKTQKSLKIENPRLKQPSSKQLIQPLNTEGMIIKPIIQKNCITKIDNQGICRLREQLDEQNCQVLKEMKITPDGSVIYMKLNKIEKVYKIQNLPEKYHKEYENCKKIVNSVKNHTPKLVFEKKTHAPFSKDIHLTVMYSGKVVAEINGKKIETTERQLQEDCVTFAENGDKFITEEQSLKHEIKCLYQRLLAI